MAHEDAPPDEPVRHGLPGVRKSITHKFSIMGIGYDGNPKSYEGYVTVGLYENGQPGEVFVRFAKMGGRQGALLDAWCTSVSIMLQHGIPLDTLITKFKGWGFEPHGLTTNDEIRMCSSPLDYIVRWLELKFSREEESE